MDKRHKGLPKGEEGGNDVHGCCQASRVVECLAQISWVPTSSLLMNPCARDAKE